VSGIAEIFRCRRFCGELLIVLAAIPQLQIFAHNTPYLPKPVPISKTDFGLVCTMASRIFETCAWWLVGTVYIGLKIAGGIYLVYLASKIWRGAKTPLSLDGMQPGHAGTGRKAFWTGLGTQMSNPKTAIVYGSIFAALLPQNPPLWCYIGLPPSSSQWKPDGTPSSRYVSPANARARSTCDGRHGSIGWQPVPSRPSDSA